MLLTAYLASYPCIFFLTVQHWQRAVPALQFFYAPLHGYNRNPQYFGSQTYKDYVAWADTAIAYRVIGDIDSDRILRTKTDIDFTNAPLRDVVSYLSELHAHPLELDPDVDGGIEVTLQSRATLGESLTELLEPHGLVAWPAHNHIAIGTPVAIERTKDADRANNPVPIGAWILLALAIVSGISLVLLFRPPRQRPSDVTETNAN